MIYAPARDRSGATSRAEKSLPASTSVTSAPVLTSLDASAATELSTLSTQLSSLHHAELDGPTDELSESDTDSSDVLSGITSDAELAIIEAFQASVAPFSTQLLSVLMSMRDETVDRVRPRLQAMIAPNPHGTRQHPAGQHYGSGASTSSLPNGNWNSAHGLGSSRKSRQLEVHNDDGDDSGVDDDNEGTQKHKPASGSGPYPQTRFACVFFKRFPESKRLTRPCYGPGWVDVHRIK
jgi:hypothetical protein